MDNSIDFLFLGVSVLISKVGYLGGLLLFSFEKPFLQQSLKGVDLVALGLAMLLEPLIAEEVSQNLIVAVFAAVGKGHLQQMRLVVFCEILDANPLGFGSPPGVIVLQRFQSLIQLLLAQIQLFNP